MKVLIAEDSILISDLLAEVISRIEGIEVIGIAQNGFEAVSMVEEFNPDLVILDISMPEKDGIEALKEIRTVNDSSLIVMFTADSSELMREHCIALGANYYVSKTHLRDLLDILHDCVKENDLSSCEC